MAVNITEIYKCANMGYNEIVKSHPNTLIQLYVVPTIFFGIGMGFWGAEKIVQWMDRIIEKVYKDSTPAESAIHKVLSETTKIIGENLKKTKNIFFSLTLIATSLSIETCALKGIEAGCIPATKIGEEAISRRFNTSSQFGGNYF